MSCRRALFSLHPLGRAGGFLCNRVPGYMGSNSIGLCRQGSEVTAVWGLLTELPAAPKLLKAHTTLTLSSAHPVTPILPPPSPWESRVQLLSPMEGTELGLDQVSVRVRVKKDLGSGLWLDIVGVRVSAGLG